MTNLLAFGIVGIVGRETGSGEFSAYNGLSRRNPALSLAALVAFLSLAGMPPFAGFVAKVFVFLAAVNSGWIWLAVVGILNSIVGLYYYLNVLKAVYINRMESQDEEKHPLAIKGRAGMVLIILVAGILLIGILFGPWFGLANQAGMALF
jgi:NADH-quinone oxidoreductase subunit N